MLVLGIVAALMVCVRRWNRESGGWWRFWEWRVELRDIGSRGRKRMHRNGGEEGERRPLLGGDGNGVEDALR